MAWADHLVIIYPLWLGAMPALLKGFLEQLLRQGVAFEYQTSGGMAKKLLTGKSARIVATMGMADFVYRWVFFAHSFKALTRNTLWFCGIGPVKSTIIGSIYGLTDRQRADWLDEMRGLGDVGK